VDGECDLQSGGRESDRGEDVTSRLYRTASWRDIKHGHFSSSSSRRCLLARSFARHRLRWLGHLHRDNHVTRYLHTLQLSLAIPRGGLFARSLAGHSL